MRLEKPTKVMGLIQALKCLYKKEFDKFDQVDFYKGSSETLWLYIGWDH